MRIESTKWYSNWFFETNPIITKSNGHGILHPDFFCEKVIIILSLNYTKINRLYLSIHKLIEDESTHKFTIYTTSQ